MRILINTFSVVVLGFLLYVHRANTLKTNTTARVEAKNKILVPWHRRIKRSDFILFLAALTIFYLLKTPATNPSGD